MEGVWRGERGGEGVGGGVEGVGRGGEGNDDLNAFSRVQWRTCPNHTHLFLTILFLVNTQTLALHRLEPVLTSGGHHW